MVEEAYAMEVKVIPFQKGEKVDVGNNSWSCHLITNKSAGATRVMLGLSTFTPGTDTPQKIHTEEELCYILKGRGSITMGEEEIFYQPGEAVFIPAGVPHGVRNRGDEDVVMVYVFSSPQYPPTRDA